MGRVRIVVAVSAGLLALVGAGCSSHLSVSELEASNRSAAFDLVRSDPAAAPGAPTEVPRTGGGGVAAGDQGGASVASPTTDASPAAAAGAGSQSPSSGSGTNAAPGA